MTNTFDKQAYEWLEENQLSYDIWNKKYRYNNECFAGWLDRVSAGDEKIKRLIKEKKFLFGGRVMSNRGINNSASLFNCYSRGYVEDDYKDIMQACMDIGLTFKGQGGQGLSLSKIRPKGSQVGNSFTSDGIVPFMKMFNEVTSSTQQGGSRKGALLISLDALHKEALNFITIKSEEGIIDKANLSLEIDDLFMNAVKTYFDTGEEITIHQKRTYSGHVVEYDVVPIKVFKALVDNCYDWGDPGCIFTDRFRNYNIMEYCDNYQIHTANPCFCYSSKILTSEGYKEIGGLEGTEPYIISGNGTYSKSKIWHSGKKETVRIHLSNQHDIICTPDHIFLTKDGREVKASDLKHEFLHPAQVTQHNFDNKYIKFGFIQGDGTLTSIKNGKNKLCINVGINDDDILELFADDEYRKYKRVIYLSKYNKELIDLGFSIKVLPEREFPSTYDSWSHKEKASFLHGCYSANGSVIKIGRVSYKTTSKAFADKLLETLTNDFNIDCYITTNKPSTIKFRNGTYTCKQSYDVNICRYDSIIRFAGDINFYQQYKKQQLYEMMLKRAPKVIRVDKNEELDVYDFSEPNTHWGVIDGYIAHNCGEQPLAKNSACCLSSINLSVFVNNPYTDAARFDYEDFEYTVRAGIEALDGLIDENSHRHPLQAQRDMSINFRNIGLGVFGYATMLMKLGLRYGSKEAVEFTDNLFYIMFRTAVFKSADLALVNGTFPKYDPKVWDSTIIKKHFGEGEIDRLRSTGLRNCSLLSIAPTGSIGTLLGETGGIEPEFALEYNRRTIGMTNGEDKYYKVKCRALREYNEVNGDDATPDYIVSSADINWEDRINTQACIQKHIDTGISSTVNLPQEATKEDMSNIYLSAWKKGLKGVTIFRNGCKKTGILSTDKPKISDNSQSDNKLNIAKNNELKRGYVKKITNDSIGLERHISSGCGSLHCSAFFDRNTGELLETYLSKGSKGGCLSSLGGMSRLISLAARAGTPIEDIIDQLKSSITCPSYAIRRATTKDTSPGSSCPAAVGYALADMNREMKYLLENKNRFAEDNIEEDDDVISEDEEVSEIEEEKEEPYFNSQSETDKCPECGAPVIHEGGCVSCKACGFSKCD